MNRISCLALAVTVTLSACVMDLSQLKVDDVNFVKSVKPILEASCLECHQHQYEFAGLNLETKAQAMKGGRSGAVIVPGSPHQSLLYKVLLLGHDSPVAMPPTPERLGRDYEQTIHDWIQQGAKWPEGVRLTSPQDKKKSRS